MKIIVNGIEYHPTVSPTMRLLDYIRKELKLTGTKEGCGEGECGACSVLINGKLVNSCMVLLGQIDGKSVTTIEGIDEPELFRAFEETGAVQCGFCTPGMIIAATALLRKNPNPSVYDIKEAISGNLCRCTGYKKIVEAIKRVKRET